MIYVFSNEYEKFDYGPSHPLRVRRLGLTFELSRELGLISEDHPAYRQARPADHEELKVFHDPYYLEALEEANGGFWTPGKMGHGLGTGDNPIFKGVYDWSALLTGATLICQRAVDGTGEERAAVAFNPAGGMHHAGPAKASGFCYINDAALAITNMVAAGLRVLYVDIDAHHGDGVQWAFFRTNQVLTLSIHQSGQTLFPGTGSEYEQGEGEAKGYAVNVPLLPDADDEVFRAVFDEVVIPVAEAFRPDVLVTQLGVDMMFSDPLSNINLTSHGFMHAVRGFKFLDKPWLALGGGGYNMSNVARCWTLAWAEISGQEAPEMLPPDFSADLPGMAPKGLTVHHSDRNLHGRRWSVARDFSGEVIEFHRQNTFPILGVKA